MSAPELEWAIQKILLNGFAYIRKYPDSVAGFLHKYEDTVQNLIKEYIVQHPNINVVMNFPMKDLSIPHISIFTASDTESSQEAPVGDVTGVETYMENEVPIGHALDLGYVSNVVVQVNVTTNDGFLTNLLFEIIWRLIFLHKHQLFSENCLVTMSLNASDFVFDPTFFPEIWKSRSLSISGKSINEMKLGEMADLPIVKNSGFIAGVPQSFDIGFLTDSVNVALVDDHFVVDYD